MKVQIETSLNPSHEKFVEMMTELNSVIDILTRNTVLENAHTFLDTVKFHFIEYGKGNNHIWVKLKYNDELSERVLIATEQ